MVYLGDEGLSGFFNILKAADDPEQERIFSLHMQNCVMCSILVKSISKPPVLSLRTKMSY